MSLPEQASIERYAPRDSRSAQFFFTEFSQRAQTLRKLGLNQTYSELSHLPCKPSFASACVLYGLYDVTTPGHLRYEVLLPLPQSDRTELKTHWPIVFSYGFESRRPGLSIDGLYVESAEGGLIFTDSLRHSLVPHLTESLQQTINRYGLVALIDGSTTYSAEAQNTPTVITGSRTNSLEQVIQMVRWNTQLELMMREAGWTVNQVMRMRLLHNLGLPGQQNEGHL